jgi:hypothetical protein
VQVVALAVVRGVLDVLRGVQLPIPNKKKIFPEDEFNTHNQTGNI